MHPNSVNKLLTEFLRVQPQILQLPPKRPIQLIHEDGE